MSRTVVHLLRHGEVHNPEHLLYGRLPGYRLSERGEAQAAAVAGVLAAADLAAVLASPLERAQQTAAPIAADHGLDILTDKRLIEAGNRFEGMRFGVGDGALRNPRYWWWLRNPFRPSWGEPYREIAERMLAAVHRARGLADGHEAVCVSHQLPIWTLRQYLAGNHLWHDPRHRECALASLTSLEFDGERLAEVRVLGARRRERPHGDRGMSRVRLLLAALAVSAVLGVTAGCATGKDAVAAGGEFQFVAPGGQTQIRYDPPDTRGALHGLSGPSLSDPNRTIGLDDYAGQVVVLNIWGSWCGPCQAEMPGLQQISETTKPAGVTVLGIDIRDTMDSAADFVSGRGITFPSIFDPPGRSLAALSGFPRNAVPSTIVLDRQHRVAAVFLTSVRISELLPVVQQVAAEPRA